MSPGINRHCHRPSSAGGGLMKASFGRQLAAFKRGAKRPRPGGEGLDSHAQSKAPRPAEGSHRPGPPCLRVGAESDALPDDSTCRVFDHVPAPVVIGGLGGSGTRLVAELAMAMGVRMGSDLNESSDDLGFTLVFKHHDALRWSAAEFDAALDTLVASATGCRRLDSRDRDLARALAQRPRDQHSAHWLQQRAAALLRGAGQAGEGEGKPLWGWKEPNSHVVLHRLLRRFPGLKYVHVVRHGLDMAHSGNQNQLRLWGECFLEAGFPLSPRNALRFWVETHRRVQALFGGSSDRLLLLLDYDDLCRDPQRGIARLAAFLGIHMTPARAAELAAAWVKPPAAGIGRWRTLGAAVFDPKDVQYVAQLGYDTSEAEPETARASSSSAGEARAQVQPQEQNEQEEE